MPNGTIPRATPLTPGSYISHTHTILPLPPSSPLSTTFTHRRLSYRPDVCFLLWWKGTGGGIGTVWMWGNSGGKG